MRSQARRAACCTASSASCLLRSSEREYAALWANKGLRTLAKASESTSRSSQFVQQLEQMRELVVKCNEHYADREQVYQGKTDRHQTSGARA
jgi:hypothetical protein